jgi:uncharacterized protein YcfL
MNKKMMLGACLAAALAMVGCRSQTDTVYVGDKYGPPYRWVQTDSDLKEYAKVVSATRDRQNGLLRVQVDLQNTRSVEHRIVYKFVWLDDKGIEVTSITNDWLPRIISGKETVQLVGIAPDPRITDCIVKLKESTRD